MVPPSDFQGGKRDWRLSQLPMTADVINHVCIMNPQKQTNKKKTKEQGSKSIQAGEHLALWEEWPQKEHGSSHPFSHTLPWAVPV